MRTGYCGFSSTEMLELARLFLVENVPGLAVWFTSITLRRVRRDSQKHINIDPSVVVSWHDTEMFSGTVYRASNFIDSGKAAKPRKRGNVLKGKFTGIRRNTPEDLHQKHVWIYPLDTAARNQVLMCNGSTKLQPKQEILLKE